MEDEESQEKSILHRFADSPSFPLAMIAFGAFIALAESLFLLLQGESIENAIWPQAVRTLSWTFLLREKVSFSLHFSLQSSSHAVFTHRFNIIVASVSKNQFRVFFSASSGLFSHHGLFSY